MLALRDGGAEPLLCASNRALDQDDVALALVAEGIPVFAIRGEDADTYYKHIHAVLDHAPAITMDDGADLATLLHTDRRDIEVIGSTEETTTGVIRLKAMAADGTLRSGSGESMTRPPSICSTTTTGPGSRRSTASSGRPTSSSPDRTSS